MRDNLCDVINYCASSFDVGKVSLYYKNCNLKPEKREKMEMKNTFLYDFHLIDGLGVEFIAC